MSRPMGAGLGTRRALGGLALALGLAGSAGCGTDPPPPVDRIVLVTIDTLRADRVGCYGDETAHTPVLDGLAATGVRFDAAISPAPLTLPSHASMLTGLDPPAHGVRSNSVYELSPEVPLATESLKEAGYATAAFVAAFVLDARYGLDRGFDHYDDDTSQRSAGGVFSVAERRADQVVDSALAWIDGAPERFFVWVHLYDPHMDYDPPPRYARLVPGDAYAGEIAFSDAQVGRLLAGIERRFGPDGTAVLVTSDHGDALGEHGEISHGLTVYDATQRVPLLLRGPGLPQGAVVDAPVRSIDVAPTLLALAGAAPLPNARGRSLLPLALGRKEDPRLAYSEATEPQLGFGWSPLLAVRTATHRYIRAPRPELFDLAADPDERHDLSASEPERVAELDAALEALLADARSQAGAKEAPDSTLTPEERARLEALGYVVPDPDGLATVEVGRVGGPDPKDHMHEAAAMQRARDLVNQGLGERALAVLTGMRLRSKQLRLVRREAALLAGRHDVLEEVGREMLAEGAETTDGLAVLGAALAGQGRLDEAERTFEELRALSPDGPEAPIGLANIARTRGDRTAEREWTELADSLENDPETARLMLALLELREGNRERGYELLATVPDSFAQRGNRPAAVAQAEHSAGDSEAALRRLAEVSPRGGESRMLHATRAQILESLGRTGAAVEARRAVLALSPNDPGAKNDLAWSLALEGSALGEALMLAREASQALDDSPTVLDTLATVHLARGEAAEALATADRALADAPPQLRPHLHYVRAEALAALGRTAEARAALRALASEDEPLGPPWGARVEALAGRLGS